jgi:hypothetical protein
MKNKYATFSVSVLCWVAGGALAAAEVGVRLIKGKGVPICEAYLVATQDWDPLAVGCFSSLPLEAPGLERVTDPVLKREFYDNDESDPLRPLLADAYKFVMRNDINPALYYYRDQIKDWRRTPAQMMIARIGIENKFDAYLRESVIRSVSVDLDNDGHPEQIMFYPHCATGSMVETSTTMSSPMILTDDGRVDAKRTRQLLRTPLRFRATPEIRRHLRRAPVPVADIFSRSAYGVLRFQGKTYWDFWWHAKQESLPDPADANVLRIYQSEHGRSRSVCAFNLNVPQLVLP